MVPRAAQSRFAVDESSPSPYPLPRSNAPAFARDSSCPIAARCPASATSSVPLLRLAPRYQKRVSSGRISQVENLLVLFIFPYRNTCQQKPISLCRRHCRSVELSSAVIEMVALFRGGLQLRERLPAKRKTPARRKNPAAGAHNLHEKNYFRIASFNAFAGRRRTTVLALILIASPVCGLRPMRALRCALTTRPMPGITNLPAPPLASFTASLCNSSKKRAACFFAVPSFSAICETIFVLLSGLAAIYFAYPPEFSFHPGTAGTSLGISPSTPFSWRKNSGRSGI